MTTPISTLLLLGRFTWSVQRSDFGGHISTRIYAEGHMRMAMAEQSMDDAMVVIQEASSAIVKVSQQLSGLEGKQCEVVQALKDLSNRISELESNAAPQKKSYSYKVSTLYQGNKLCWIYFYRHS